MPTAVFGSKVRQKCRASAFYACDVGRILGIGVVLAVMAAVAPGALGGKSSTKPDGPLRWQAPARTQAVAGAASDHLLFGRVVNHGTKTLRLRAADVHLLGPDGKRLPTRAAFADGFVPGVMLSGYASEMYGGGDASVGRVIVLKTGQAAPLAASFTAASDKGAVAIEYDGGRLKLK
jgi:hypothetical protein